MEFRCQCECGEMFKKTIEKPSNKQVAEEMYYGFLSVDCEEHK
jgi:hypothetical protein